MSTASSLTRPCAPFAAAAAVAAAVLLGTVLLATACGGDSTGPEESICDRLDVSRDNFSIDFVGACSQFEASYNNIRYDDTFGNVIGFEFDIRCSTSSERYTGRVYDITYGADHNTVVAWRAEVNGQSCRFP